MKLIDQTLFGDKNGNCFGACVSTITGIPLSEIPNFCATHDDASWYQAFADWLRPFGFAPISFLFANEKATRNHLDWARAIAPTTPWIACGDTDRGKHAVVFVGHKMAHDPNPNHGRAGVDRVEDATFIVRTIRTLGVAVTDVVTRPCELCVQGGDDSEKPCELREDTGIPGESAWLCADCYAEWRAQP